MQIPRQLETRKNHGVTAGQEQGRSAHIAVSTLSGYKSMRYIKYKQKKCVNAYAEV